jgi:hypothetical protein
LLLVIAIIRRIIVGLKARARHHTGLICRVRRLPCRLGDLLFAVREYDTVIMFGVLQIVLG